MKEKVLITGCAGLFGANLTRHLVNKNFYVIGIDDLSGGYADYLPDVDNFEFWPIDLSDEDGHKALEDICVNNNIKSCYHFAAYAAEGLSPFIRYFNYKNNILSSANIINACVNHNMKLIFTSSIAVYGDQQSPFTETMIPQPVDPYGVAKYAIEQDIKIAASQHGLPYTIIRPHNVVGIYQNIWDKYRNVVGIFIRKVLNGEPMLIYGDGEQTRAFSDIKYYMEPLEKIGNQFTGMTFNLGSDKTYTVNNLASVVEEVAFKHGIKARRKYVEERHEVKHAYCDHSLAKNPNGLNFEDNTNLKDLVNTMFTWAITQPKREQKRMPYEITKGMYEYWK